MPKLDTDRIARELREFLKVYVRHIPMTDDRLEAAVNCAVAAIAVAAGPYDHNGECLYCDELGEHDPECICYLAPPVPRIYPPDS